MLFWGAVVSGVVGSVFGGSVSWGTVIGSSCFSGGVVVLGQLLLF